MSEDNFDLLDSLRPRQANKIMGLVEQVGIDVSPWRVKKDGSKVKIPAANPNFCYDWAFGGSAEPTALCVWHKSLEVNDGMVSFNDNLRNRALELERKSETKDREMRTRARDQAKRARMFDIMLQHRFRKSQPVRIILVEGDRISEEDLGSDKSAVKLRSLDTEYWHIHDYADDGQFRLVRSVLPKSAGQSLAVESDQFADQFSIPNYINKRESTASVYIRSPEVRQTVLRRAAGVCEYCDAPGFKADDGMIFLETHHVIPLAEKGPDVEWNVVAICPNDHRRAHYAENRDDLREQLLAILIKYYPNQTITHPKLPEGTYVNS